jgi:hypothetical protein
MVIPYVYGRLRRRGRNDDESIRLVVPSSRNDLGSVETKVIIYQPTELFENPKLRTVRRDVYLDTTHRPSVGIATDYGLYGPGIESRLGGRDFPHLSRPALGPTQPPVQCVPGLSRGRKRPGRDASRSPPSSAEV